MRRIRIETSDYINSFDRTVFDQIREKSLDQITTGLVSFSLAVILATLVLYGVASIWLLFAIFVLAGAVVAHVLRKVGRFVVAAIVLVVALVAIVAGMLLTPNALNSFIPYLFIPVVIVAGLVLSPLAVAITVLASISLAAIMLALAGQLTLANLLVLLPPFSLAFIVGLLAIEGGQQFSALQNLVLSNKRLLRERTRETAEAQRETGQLKQHFAEPEKNLSRAQTEQASKTATKNNKLFGLFNGTIRELGSSVKELEQLIERVEELPQSAEQAILLEDVWQKIYHLANLKVSLDEMVRLENDEISLQRQPVDTANLIKEVVSTAQGLARAKSLTLHAQLPEDLPELYVDPDRLRQALLRILNNAVQYTDEGKIEVRAEASDDELVILVSDTGIGIEPEDAELIFHKFGRAANPLAKPRQGPGLGLAISERFIKLHGGRLWVSSVPGVGSTFYVSLPLAKPSDEPLTTLTAASAPIDPDGTIISVRPEPQTLPAPLADDDPLLVSSLQLTATQSNLGPVARFSSTYTSRFGFILLSTLLVITICLAFFALRYGISRPEETSLTEQSAAEEPSEISANTFSSEENAGLAKTSTPVSIRTPPATIAALPLASSTLPLPTPLPPTSSPTPTATFNQSQWPLTPSPSFTPVPPTQSATATPTKSATATPVLSDGPEVSAALSQPSPTPTVQSLPTPISQKIFFVSDQNGNYAATRLDLADTTGETETGTAETVNNSRVSRSPNGQLLFTTDRHGNREIYLSRADGSQPQRLTATDGDNTQPVWSPDGKMIAFSSGRTGNFEIFVMDGDGNNPIQLTTSRGFDEWPVWSADGQKIAFVSDRDGNVEIYTMNADGSHQQRLTHHPADDWPASWSPDGNKLVFSSNRDLDWNLYVVEVDSGHTTRLTNDPANEREPAWSPDGRTIAFAYDGNGNWDIYTLSVPPDYTTEVPRGEWEQGTDSPVDERYPTWAP